MELPPRTRRIRPRLPARIIAHGTTSAHAENTFQVAADGCHSGNYLRARGEYMPPTPAVTGFLELPPRTRRIPRSVWPMVTTGGTTSAHAENTHVRVKYSDFPRNYLRARGEYFFQGWGAHNPPELPPRTRRIPFKKCFPDPKIRNYLRARGEYQIEDPWDTYLGELPPRTRRILSNGVHCESGAGTTSAHAENTPCRDSDTPQHWNYLRARGEYATPIMGASTLWELPPRTRRIRGEGANLNPPIGTTSAHAENTVPWGGDES